MRENSIEWINPPTYPVSWMNMRGTNECPKKDWINRC